MDSSLVSTCPVVELSADEEAFLPVKNTFVHFDRTRRTLRSSRSEPADPVLPPIGKSSCEDCVDAETTDDCSECDVLSIQTPEMTPRCMESPSESLATSPWGMSQSSAEKQQIIVEKHQIIADAAPQYFSDGLCYSHMCLQFAYDPPQCYLPFSFTLRLEDKGSLGVEFGSLSSHCHPVVRAIVPGRALDAWNRQCFFGNNMAPMSRYVSPGDLLLSVNGKVACHEMLYECQEKLLLKMAFGRTEKWSIQRI